MESVIITHNYKFKKLVKLLIIVFVSAISIKIIYTIIGHSIVKAMYDGKLVGFLNNIIRGQSEHSLEYYYIVADKLATEIVTITVINLSVLTCFLFLPPIILSKWSSGKIWLET